MSLIWNQESRIRENNSEELWGSPDYRETTSLPSRAREWNAPEFPCTPDVSEEWRLHGGFRTMGLRLLCSGRCPPGLHRTRKKHRDSANTNWVISQNQDWHRHSKDLQIMQRPRTNEMTHSAADVNQQRVLQSRCTTWALQSALELGLNFREWWKLCIDLDFSVTQ